MKQITDDYIARVWDGLWDELEAAHKSPFSVPIDERNAASEKLRALHVVQEWQRSSPTASLVATLNSYSITEAAIDWILAEHATDAVKKAAPTERPQSRKQKWGEFTKWAKSHAGQEFTTEQLAEVSGFSYAATLSFIKSNPLFLKVKKGVWRVASEGK
jgi:hypothetical protein